MYQEAGQHSGAAGEPETSVMAIGSVVAGILGFSLLPTIGRVIARGLGYAARRDLRSNESLKGERLATAGIVLGWRWGFLIAGLKASVWQTGY